MPAPNCPVTVIIPALNEATFIRETIFTTVERLPGVQVVLVDGASTDATAAIAAGAGATVVTSARGRGVQCQAGAATADSEWLLFLHADTLLPRNADAIVAAFIANAESHVATFRLRFDTAGFFLRSCCWFTRVDSVFTRFGDQGILIRRAFYHKIGGFPPWPLFEDVALLQRARRRTRIFSLPAAVTTSARRFQAHGHLWQQWLNARLLFRYLRGTSPHVLAEEYRAARRAKAMVLVPPQQSGTTRV